MLVIAVGYGAQFVSDPFTCSIDFPAPAETYTTDEILWQVCEAQSLSQESIDELILIQGDKVVNHKTRNNQDF